MKILIAGAGGREHALAWKLAQSPSVARLFAVPGNPGIAKIADCIPSQDLSPGSLLDVARSVEPDLTVIGPEAPLVAGVVDRFRAEGRAIIGPTAEAAQLEGSKIYAKRFFERLGIPTARFTAADNARDARRVCDRFGFPVVVKADGLASGKGVVVAHDRAEAERAIDTVGETAGPRLVIEEFLEGEEVSFIALCDGRDAAPFVPAQDHKAAFDGDEGPNTGGMGAYCDPRILDEAQTRTILDTVVRPTVEATGFTGFLYAGLVMTAAGPRLLEYNVRLGDPEAQALLHSLAGDLPEILMACAHGELGSRPIPHSSRPSVCVALASAGYPGAFVTGVPIRGIDEAEAVGTVVFHAGTRMGASGLETAGGRVVGVTASGSDLRDAIANAYRGVREIYFEGLRYRTDIGARGLRRYNTISGT